LFVNDNNHESIIMLQEIRDKAQGWIAYGIVILITIPFALWGIQSYLGVGSEAVAAKVNGTEITERALDNQFERFRQQLREQLGAAYRPELIDDNRMRDEVLNRMVRDELVQQVSHDMGLRVSDGMVQATLLGMQAFQKNGVFDQTSFERAARLQGLSPAGMMDRIRSLLLAQQLPEAIGAGTFVTPHELAESQRLTNQKRELSYFVVPAADYLVDAEISDDQVQHYYETNQADYIAPERVKLDYLLLNATTAGSTVEVNDEVLRGYYSSNEDKFGLPEQRRASHILILVPEDADEAAVKAARSKIDELATRLAQGEDFAALAKAESQDPGSAAKGGDLGYFGKGVMDPAFESAVFSQPLDKVGKPVRSKFGFHLIKVTGIKQGEVKPFEEVKPEVEKAYRKSEGEKRYYEMADNLANLSYDDPDSLDPAAQALGLQVQHSDWITRDFSAAPLASPKVRNAAFSEDVLQAHHNSEVIELDNETSVVVRVTEHEDEMTRPLEEVKAQIIETLRQQNAEAQAKAEADKRLQAIKGGSPLLQVAADYAVTGPLAVGRNDRLLPVELSSAIFRSEKPVEGAPVPGMAKLANGDFAVYALTAVMQGEVDEKSAKQQTTNLRRQMERGLYEEFLADLKSQADIEILLKKSKE
jgi:peptidyl-prolyl cis-trans isomerase D